MAAIPTDSGIFVFGDQDTVTTGTPAAISNNTMVIANQNGSATWSNDDDAPFGAAVLKYDFGTAPTVGELVLCGRLHKIDGSTGNQSAPDTSTPANFNGVVVGSFKIKYGVATAETAVIPLFEMPMVKSAQEIEWYIWNNKTAQTVDASWTLYITPIALKPHA